MTTCVPMFRQKSSKLQGHTLNSDPARRAHQREGKQTEAKAQMFGSGPSSLQNSAAKNQGDHFYSNMIPFDLLNVNRTINPDLGAYQHVIQDD